MNRFRVASHLHMTVEQLGNAMDAHEYIYWLAYLRELAKEYERQ